MFLVFQICNFIVKYKIIVNQIMKNYKKLPCGPSKTVFVSISILVAYYRLAKE